MSRQITIMVMIDSEAAIAEGTLENNIYLIDSERQDGSTGEGTQYLTTAVGNGFYRDGSQAEEVVLNWCVTYIASAPPTLPRFYAAYMRKKKRAAALTRLLDGNGVTPPAEIKLLRSPEDMETDFSPYISGISGEAVEKGVIFPAQYGTPVPVHGGWYWSASVSTYQPGVYKYKLHITLSRRNKGKTEAVEMTHEAYIRIDTAPQRNGFTGGGIGFIPIAPHATNINKKETEL